MAENLFANLRNKTLICFFTEFFFSRFKGSQVRLFRVNLWERNWTWKRVERESLDMLQMSGLSTTRSKTAGILRLGEGSDRKAILAGPKSFTNSRIGLLQSALW